MQARVATHLKLRRLQQQLAWQNDHLQRLVEVKARELVAEREQRDLAERESQRRLAEIAHMNRNASATVYCAALVHELNQPLAAILANAEAAELMLGGRAPALAEVAEILSDIRRDDLRASELIQQMRAMLRKSEAIAVRLDLNDVVGTATGLLASEARMRQVAVAAVLSPTPLPVSADPVQLQQVLVNLILNSMDAMHGLQGRRRIEIRAVSEGSQAVVEVCDDGCGFGTDLERAFESFYSTKQQGMGLGLSISQAIIASHGGQTWARNNDHGGATVGFHLPLLGPAP